MVMPNWNSYKIGQLLEFKNGLNKDKEFFGFGTPIINYVDVYSHTGLYRGDIAGKVSLTSPEIKRYEAKKGDVFFTRTSETPDEVGLSCVLLEEIENCVFSGFILRGRPITDLLDINYCRYCFRMSQIRAHIISECTYTTRALTNGRQLSKIEIELPPISEQKAIASALSDMDELIVSLENLIEKKKAIKQGAMQELLAGKKRLDGFSGEWVEMRLGDVAKLTMGQSPNSQYYNVSKGVPLIQGNADIENRKTIIRFYTEHITKKAYSGDIIFTVRAPVGNVAKATFDCCLGRGVCAIQYENDFLYHYLVFIEGFWNSLSTGSTFDSINSTDLNNSIVKLPPTFAEQTSIVTILSDMDNEIETLTHKLEKCCQIKQGMMQELLTGRIRLVDTASKKQRKEKIISRGKLAVQPQGHNEHFHEAVILSAVVSLFASEKYPLGRFRRQKLAYLLHRHAQESTQGFLKKAAGPYNPTIRYKDEKIALKAGYVAERGNGKFVKGEKTNEAVNYFTQWYGEEAIEWLKQFQFRKNDELEVLTTVAEAIADLKKNSLTITVEAIKQVIQSNPEWRPKLDKTYFNDINIQSAMRESQKLFA